MNAIKEARLAKGWSQIETAAKLGVHVLTYQLWERGAGKPNPENRRKLEELLGVRFEENADHGGGGV